jgi:hypothetical protein
MAGDADDQNSWQLVHTYSLRWLMGVPPNVCFLMIDSVLKIVLYAINSVLSDASIATWHCCVKAANRSGEACCHQKSPESNRG